MKFYINNDDIYKNHFSEELNFLILLYERAQNGTIKNMVDTIAPPKALELPPPFIARASIANSRIIFKIVVFFHCLSFFLLQ